MIEEKYFQSLGKATKNKKSVNWFLGFCLDWGRLFFFSTSRLQKTVSLKITLLYIEALFAYIYNIYIN